MSGITIIRAEGGLGRQQPGSDYISGLLFKQTTLPSGFGANDRIKKVTTLAEAVALGIDDSHSDETKATGGAIEVTAAGADGDVWTATITPSGAPSILLGTYTEKTSDTPTLIGAGIADSINALTGSHGFTASASLGVVSLVAPDKYGASLNGAGLTGVSSGSGTTTVTQFSGGVGSEIAVLHYHVSEFFSIAEKITGLAQGILYIGIYASYDGTQIGLMQNFASGDIRNLGIFLPDTFASSQVTATQTGATSVEAVDRPLSCVLAADFSATTLSALSDLRTLNSKNVSVVIGQDVKGEGGRLAGVCGFSITSLGTTLGAVSQSAVHENIGWRQKFDVTHSRSRSVITQSNPFNELEVLGFATGELYADQSKATINALTEDGYVFLVKEDGKTASYHNDSPTATAITSDFAYIENNRTIDKAARLIKENLTPKTNAPLYVNATTGKLSEGTIADFKNSAFKALENMAVAGEISTNESGELPANSIVINPDQNVLATSEIALTVQIVPVGVARAIKVTIGFAVSIK